MKYQYKTLDVLTATSFPDHIDKELEEYASNGYFVQHITVYTDYGDGSGEQYIRYTLCRTITE